MTRTALRPTLLGLLALLVPATAAAQAAPPAADPGPRVDSVFAAWAAGGGPGCAVGVSQRGRTVLARGYGMADLDQGTANTGATIFEAGSVAKQFTVAAAVLLALDGKLSLDDDVRRYVPELPEYEAPVTLRHLIHHTSGLRDWGTVVAAAGWPRTSRVHTHAHVLDVLSRQRSLNYTPGAEYSYTNSGFNLLAIVVERVSGEPFAEFSRRRIFEPLGMRDTRWRDDHTRVVRGRATAYAPGPDGDFRILMPFENVHGNGGLLTTVSDLLTWTRNLETGAFGGEPLLREMHRQGRLNDGREIAYAGGLRVSTYRGVREVGHSGSTAGYRAYLTRFPDQDVAVAVLCNAANANAGALAYRTADLFLGDALRPEPAPRPVRVPAAALEARAGLYRNLRTHEPVRIAVRDGRLRMDGRTELVPLSPTLFQAGDSRLDFAPGRAYRAGSVRLVTEEGDEIELERVAEATPDAARLAEYAGEYHSDEAEVSYTVEVVDGTLRLRRRPDAAQPLTPQYADAFTTPAGWLVRFTRGSDGRVDGMSFGMGRVRDLRFTRGAR